MSWVVQQPVIGPNDDIFFGSDTTLYAYRKDGTRRWSSNVGARIGGAPALGSDGTIYVAGANGYVGARNYDGAFKWQLNVGTAAFVTNVMTGQNGRIFVGNDAGSVQSLLDGGTNAWISWKYELGSGRATKMALSHDGRTLYIASTTGQLHAISTSTGARVFNPVALGTAALNVLLVLDNGYLFTGSDGGEARILTAAGTPVYLNNVGGKIRAAAVAPNRMIYVLTAKGSPLYTQLYALRRDLTAYAGFEAWTNMPGYGYALIVDAASQVYGVFAPGRLVGVTATGRESFDYGVDSLQSVTAMAMDSQGSIVFSQGFTLAQSLQGAPPVKQTVNYKPRVPYFDGDSVPSYTTTYAQQCDGSHPVNARPGYDYTTDSQGRITSISLDATETDPGCPVQFCTDTEVPITNADDIRKLLSTQVGDTTRNIPTLPASYNRPTCTATKYETGCEAIDPTGIDFDDACRTHDDCGSGEICATVCPENGTTGRPLDSCGDTQRIQVCAELDLDRCAVLPYAGTGCHELRECAAPEDRVSAADAQPACFPPSNSIPETVGTTDTAAKDRCDDSKPKVKDPMLDAWTANYKEIELWDTTVNTCLLENPEDGSNADGGGNGTDSGRRNKSKWGLWAGANTDMEFAMKPLPMGFIVPDASAHANFDVLAKVWGKEIIVLDVGARAIIDQCNISATATTKLFNQTINTLGTQLANTSDVASCKYFYEQLKWGAGNIKNYLMAATRAYEYVKETEAAGRTAVTLEMCELAYAKPGVTRAPECQPPYTAAKAAAVVNRLIAKYTQAVTDMQPGGKWYKDATTALVEHMDATTGFSKDTKTGRLGKTINLGNLGFPYSIIGAQATFPIGPFQAQLEVSGSGRWGLSGSLDYSATYLPPSPAAQAAIIANPHASTDVVVYLGVGFGVPGASATAGVLGKVQLVNIQTPLQGATRLTVAKKASEYPARTWPSAFSRFQGRTPLLAPQQFDMSPTASLQAALTLTALDGELDVALRLKFLFFSKTFKRRIAELKGKQWSYDWVGSFDKTLKMATVKLPVLDPIPLPSIPTVPSSTFTWLNGGVWPTQTSFPSGSAGRTHADIIGKMPRWCELIIL